MALDDLLFSQELKDYILGTTTQEDPLLERLRQETLTVTANPRMLCGPVEGQLLHLLVSLLSPKMCLELGTFTGYSALHIASALGESSKLFTCELQEEHAVIAQKYFDQSPHRNKIRLLLGDATQSIKGIDSLLDFIFIDADKANYPLYYDLLIPRLRPGGLMVVDNALWNGKVTAPRDPQTKGIAGLNQKAFEDPSVKTVMLPLRDGVLLIRKNERFHS